MSAGFSRRRIFSLFGRTFRATVESAQTNTQTISDQTGPPVIVTEASARVAVIQGRFCLAYTSICTVCSERCPVAGAMKVENGIPSVVSDICTGCGVCHDVCPAPTNAVLVIPRRRSPRFSAPPLSSTL